jgi:hypothetical protein
MLVYVANCSKQYAVLNFRVVEYKKTFSQPIDSGQQVALARLDLNQPQIDGVLEQLRTYGLWLSDELEAVPGDTVIYWLASVDKPLTEDRIRRAMMHNRLVQFERGRDFRKQAAVAVHNVLAVGNNMVPPQPHAAETMEVTIQEEVMSGTTGIDGDPAVAEGYRIERIGAR